MHKSLFTATVVITILFLVFVSCGTDDNFFPPPDFSTVPAPYNTEGVEPITPEDGVEVYILEEGTGPFYLTNRDQATVFMTLRTDEGDIIFSSFANASQSPLNINMRDAGRFQNVFQYSILLTYTPGLKVGLLGMREGEQRTIVVAPKMGYGNVSSGSPNSVYRENTLYYDIRLSSIQPK